MIHVEADRDVRSLTEVVSRLRRALRASIRSDYPWESLPMAQVEILQCLQERDGARVGELAVLLRLAPNTVSTLIQQLSDAGLLRRDNDPADRRAVRVSLTETGAHQLEGWRDAHERRIGSALAGLDPADQQTVLAALVSLSRLADRLDDQRTGGPPPAA